MFEPLRKRLLLILLIVEVGTVGLLTGLAMQTGLDLEEVRVELLFLPPVTVLALVLKLAAVLVRSDYFLCVPVLAQLIRVGEDGRLSPVVLPVVSVHTDVSLVVVLLVRTPNSFEVEEVEVHVRLELLNQLHGQVVLVVSKGTEVTILTDVSIEVGLTELGFVLVRMVKLLHSVVGFVALVTIEALLVAIRVLALL